LVILHRLGGIRTKKDCLISYVNLPNEYAAVRKLAAEEYKPLLRMISSVLDNVSWDLHVEVVPPTGLLTELFTIKGSGTFIKKGPRILQSRIEGIDKNRLKKLLESSFGKKLNDNYLGNSKDLLFFVEENYRGCAVVKRFNGISYIDKLAVLPEAQGEGIAKDIIISTMNYCHKIFWRANPENHINEWYFKLCSGVQKESKWHIYWSNLSLPEIREAINYALEKPADFIS
jgi:bifunctional N-acetylglutamate synthase/kinase